ncbi:integral membrane protein-like protein [Mollisia scopiformis]|uniref:Integral membrane protein-like protein n=1 Tax=Mollisia scopiformis TaxID=149040 RepID=A0A194XQU0_MOLSC|nr:integral membrane protein-like protein [Mollisia scopiformis]KUJ22645.1 integral membrane protein-like protein [Mollisia scopiformis]
MGTVSEELMARHPLQRLSSPSRGVSAFVHTIGIISFTLSYKYLIDFPTMINESYGWHWQYLTILGLTVAYATFVFGLLADITLSPKLFLIKNTLSLCSAPLEVLISILYWGISAIDKTLVVPPEIHIAPLADIGFHAMPSILLVIDLLFLSPPWTIHAIPAMGLSSTIAVGYWAWVEQCYRHNGFYPYPLFAALDTTQRIFLFTSAAMTMTGSTIMLQWLYGRVNGLRGAEKRSTPNNIKGA